MYNMKRSQRADCFENTEQIVWIDSPGMAKDISKQSAPPVFVIPWGVRIAPGFILR